jgi:hypothetical protein
MKFPRKFFTTIQIGVAVCSLAMPQSGFAYSHPLTDEAVRDAYFLGQDSERSATFLADYLQSLRLPDRGPHVAQIELSTPYALVVRTSQQHPTGYSAQQAAADYKQRGDYILVRVQIMFTPTYTGGEDYWRTVPVGLVQKKHMAARSVSGEALYATDHDGDRAWLIGANVFVVFSVDGVDSDTVQVEVEPPGGTTVHATFDLDRLN